MAFKKYSRNPYNPLSDKPYKLSRSRIDNYLNCPRCFYMHERKGIKAPSGPTLSLNNAVDNLYKNEFDIYRKEKKAHPLMQKHNLNCIPYDHEKLPEWRNAFKGIQWHDKETNFLLFGGIDDVWINTDDELHIVDYKATAKKTFNPNFDTGWEVCYKRQIEIYQWLFRKNGFDVQNIGYFVYCNGIKENVLFNNELKFKVKIIPHKGDDSWLDKTVKEIYQVLNSEEIPEPSPNCEYCRYVKKANL